jgi:hypothetical protein
MTCEQRDGAIRRRSWEAGRKAPAARAVLLPRPPGAWAAAEAR